MLNISKRKKRSLSKGQKILLSAAIIGGLLLIVGIAVMWKVSKPQKINLKKTQPIKTIPLVKTTANIDKNAINNIEKKEAAIVKEDTKVLVKEKELKQKNKVEKENQKVASLPVKLEKRQEEKSVTADSENFKQENPNKQKKKEEPEQKVVLQKHPDNSMLKYDPFKAITDDIIRMEEEKKRTETLIELEKLKQELNEMKHPKKKELEKKVNIENRQPVIPPIPKNINQAGNIEEQNIFKDINIKMIIKNKEKNIALIEENKKYRYVSVGSKIKDKEIKTITDDSIVLEDGSIITMNLNFK